jgi:hypothetical protein
MPSTYAHDIFARQVMERLPEPLLHICEEYPTQFLFGSQGPDFFYFYHPERKNNYTELGALMHSCTLNRFLRQILPILELYGTDSMEYAYILGFICHFALDSHCHPYVIPAVKELGFPHIAMETEFDRHLMERDGKNPLSYPLQDLIPTDQKTKKCLHHVFPDVPEDVIARCLTTYHFFRHLWVTPSRARYRITKAVLRPFPRSDYFCNFLIGEKPHPLAKTTNKEMDHLYETALSEAVSYLESFHKSFTKKEPLDVRFEKNFKQ